MKVSELSLNTTKLLSDAINKNVKLLSKETGEEERKLKKHIFDEADPHNVKLPGDVFLEAYNISTELVTKHNK